MERIFNETVVNFFENETDDDLKKNFVGYPFIIMNMDGSNKNGIHWWSFLNLHPRKEFFYLTVLGLRDLKNSSWTTIEKLSTKFYSESNNFKKKITRSRWSP